MVFVNKYAQVLVLEHCDENQLVAEKKQMKPWQVYFGVNLVFQVTEIQSPAEDVQDIIGKSDAADTGHSDDIQTNNSDSNQREFLLCLKPVTAYAIIFIFHMH